MSMYVFLLQISAEEIAAPSIGVFVDTYVNIHIPKLKVKFFFSDDPKIPKLSIIFLVVELRFSPAHYGM